VEKVTSKLSHGFVPPHIEKMPRSMPLFGGVKSTKWTVKLEIGPDFTDSGIPAIWKDA
jgi:hypothetical protein